MLPATMIDFLSRLRFVVSRPVLAAALLAVWPLHASAQVDPRVYQPGALLEDELLLVRGATLVDGTGGFPRRNVSVLVRNGRIEAVGRLDDLIVPTGTNVVDARGGWLVPGFIDVHVHVQDTATLEALLAAGITTARSPSSTVHDGVDLRKIGKTNGVRLPSLRAAGPVLDAPPGGWPGSVLVRTEAEMRAAVRAQAEAGVDVVKLYTRVPPDLVVAAVAEAHALDVPVAGDLVRTSWTEAARAGIDHLSHIVSRSPSLLPPEVRERYEGDVADGRAHAYYRWLELLELDGPEVDEMVGALLSRDVSVDPTLAAIEAVLLCADSAYAAERAAFQSSRGARGSGLEAAAVCPAEEGPADYTERARRAWPKALELVRLLHRQGVRLTAGSDAPLSGLPPGAAFHRELELLSATGIPNRHVIRIATSNGAVALGALHQVGTIEPGKRADMVLLEADPLADIRNTREIRWVMLDGRIYRPSGPPGP